MLSKCKVCGGDLIVSEFNDSYQKCLNCNSYFLTNVMDFDSDFYSNEYFDNMDYERILRNDKAHYDLFLSNIGFDIKETVKDITTIHSFGGGFPKLETLISNYKNIIVYDFIADKYEENMNLFYQYYPKNNNTFIFQKIDILKNTYIFHKNNSDNLFTFIHFFEHFTYEDTIKILSQLVLASNSYKYILIYQPNSNAIKSSNWVHFRKEHITLIPFQKFSEILSKFFNVMFQKEYFDDMFFFLSPKC